MAGEYFKRGASYFYEYGDTVTYLHCIVNLSIVENRLGNFNKAFDMLWDILPLANEIEDNKPLIDINHLLGILYGVFGKDSIALSHALEAHHLAKSYYGESFRHKAYLTSSYLDVAVRLIELERYNEAVKYLDSCYLLNPSVKRLYFIDATYGNIYLKQNKLKIAEKYLQGTVEAFTKNRHVFRADALFYMAELKQKLGDVDSATYYYRQSLEAIDSLRGNLKLKPVILKELANIFSKKQEYSAAFHYLLEAATISDSLFNIQSIQNRKLFEIKNEVKKDLKQKQSELTYQRKLLAINEESNLRLKLLIGIVFLLAVVSYIYIRLKYRMKRIVLERSLTEEKSKALLEYKNKELTASTLKMIQKERQIEELLKEIEDVAPKVHDRIKVNSRHSSKKIWNDFHLRFTKINGQFYDRLVERHPQLTASDLRQCALIKLNFDSKEMSQILGISINSVHMARSRIRKKLNLKRSDDLVSYLASV
uniref:MS121 n=1 Tax=Microscilla sp. PRE1 TaxID=155537 RepID=Q93PB0_9BACT|nr:MS121 [Microscilla sp. PRE1]